MLGRAKVLAFENMYESQRTGRTEIQNIYEIKTNTNRQQTDFKKSISQQRLHINSSRARLTRFGGAKILPIDPNKKAKTHKIP